MRSEQLQLGRYDTDKIASRYLDRYDPVLEPLVDKEVRLLEIGIHRGGSLRLWRDYFPRGRVTGIDLRLPEGFDGEERIRMFQGDQTDRGFLSRVAAEVAPDGFDVIIDDASHLGSPTKTTFWHLFDNHLKPSGLYVIEDWGTGYWEDWPDGRRFLPRPPAWSAVLSTLAGLARSAKVRWHAHSYGMVGFVKELVDEQAASDLTRARLRGTPERSSKFESVTIVPSLVFVRKRADLAS
jgi:hypothetical protein